MISYIIRPAEICDQTLLWSWRNDALTREMERITGIIPRQVYADWLRRALADRNYRVMIAESDSNAIAVSHISLRQQTTAEIGICVNPAFRGLRLSHGLLKAFTAEAHSELGFRTICAVVKVVNLASRRLFSGASYKIDEISNEFVYFSRQVSTPPLFKGAGRIR